MALEDISKFGSILLNDGILLKFEKICKDSGFMDKYVASREAAEKLLGRKIFPNSNQTPLKYVIQEYALHVMRSTKPENKYYYTVKNLLDEPANSDITKYLIDMNVRSKDLQIFCVLALSAFYFLLKEEDIGIIIEKTTN